jgi:hypothetical protein
MIRARDGASGLEALGGGELAQDRAQGLRERSRVCGLGHVCPGCLDERGAETVGEPLRSVVEPVVSRRRVAVVGACRDNARQPHLGELGLPADEQRQSFVNRLQMALFAWIKAHPAADRPLGGLLVMDEAQNYAPSGAFTPCTQSTIALASQARKYGLGLLFATQAPRGIHTNISGNAATQFFGVMNSVAHIETAKEMARGRGGPVDEISLLTPAEFFVAGEGMRFERVTVVVTPSNSIRSPQPLHKTTSAPSCRVKALEPVDLAVAVADGTTAISEVAVLAVPRPADCSSVMLRVSGAQATDTNVPSRVMTAPMIIVGPMPRPVSEVGTR